LTSFLRKFEPDSVGKKLIPLALKDDLWVWKKAINSSRQGLPLAEFFDAPPLFLIEFVSDAAGAAFEWREGKCVNTSVPGDRGVASIRCERDQALSVSLLRWPIHLLNRDKTRGGVFFGFKKWNPGNSRPFTSFPLGAPKFGRKTHRVRRG
jgi:hypothetical protein